MTNQNTKQIIQQSIKSGAAKLTRTAILASVSVGTPGNVRKDRKMTDEVILSRAMGKQSGKWDKYVFPPALHAKIVSAAGAMRTYHYGATLTWPEDGWVLLPAVKHDQYCKDMSALREHFDSAKAEFIAHIPDMIQWAKVEHNGSFDIRLYDRADIESRFHGDVEFRPVPASSHYADEIAKLLGVDAAAVDGYVENALEKAHSELWQRLINPLRNVRDILLKKSDGKETRISDSLISNVQEIVSNIPAMNVADDPVLAAAAKEIGAAFNNITSDDVRENDDKRTAALKAADELVRKFSNIF